MCNAMKNVLSHNL